MRKNIVTLSSDEWNSIVARLNSMKRSGAYDAFTQRHMDAMMNLTRFAGETNTQRNVAHRGPAFLPWHRQSLLEFEAEFGLSLPYWNWEVLGSNWRRSRVWNLIGANGSASEGGRITTGPFAGWTSIIFNSNGTYAPRSGIIRQWSSGGSMNPVSMGLTTYDVSPWSESTDLSRSFRQTLEQAHNTVHSVIGGDIRSGTSPNDPLFWFHHCNVERIFWRWQARNGYNNYAPVTGGPLGHNRGDTMRRLGTSVTVGSVLDARTLGVSYDTLG